MPVPAADTPPAPARHTAAVHTAVVEEAGTPAVPGPAERRIDLDLAVDHKTVAGRTAVPEEAVDHTVPALEEVVGRTAPVPGEGMEAAAGRTGLAEEHRTGLVEERRIDPVPGVRHRVVVRLGEERHIGPGEHHTAPVALRRKGVVRQLACSISHPWYRSSSRSHPARACTATDRGLNRLAGARATSRPAPPRNWR